MIMTMPRCCQLHYGRTSWRESFASSTLRVRLLKATITSLSCNPHSPQTLPVVKPALWHSFGKKTDNDDAGFECWEGSHSPEHEAIGSRLRDLYLYVEQLKARRGFLHCLTSINNIIPRRYSSADYDRDGSLTTNMNHLTLKMHWDKDRDETIASHTIKTTYLHSASKNLSQVTYADLQITKPRPRCEQVQIVPDNVWWQSSLPTLSWPLISHEVGSREHEWLLGRDSPISHNILMPVSWSPFRTKLLQAQNASSKTTSF